MESSQKILLITNKLEQTELETLRTELSQTDARSFQFELLYIKPTIASCYYYMPSMNALLAQYHQQAILELSTVSNYLNIPEKNQSICEGKIKTQTIRMAEKLKCDYILSSASVQKQLQSCLFGLRRKPKEDCMEAVIGIRRLCRNMQTHYEHY